MISLEVLESFGKVAAEDEPVLEYFLTTDAAQKIQNQEAFVVLGRKGSGKTALVRYFAEGSGPTISRSLSLRGYPWNVHATRLDHGASEVEAYVAAWRYLLCLELAVLVLSRKPESQHPKAKAIKNFLNENYGGIDPVLADVLKPPKLKLAGTSLEPEMFGFKLGSISFNRSPGDLGLGSELKALSDLLLDAAIDIAHDEHCRGLLLHFDELDQGITTFDEKRATMLVGLVLAAREVRQTTKHAFVPVNPVVYLRTDLWDDLVFSDKNKISQTSTLNLEWSSKTLLDLVNTRLSAKLGSQADWQAISTSDLMRGSQTKWNHILARTFLRPRDVIRFLNAMLVEAKKRAERPLLFNNQDVTNARDTYSVYLKQELVDEIGAHWDHWEEALQACSALATITFRREDFVSEYNRRKSLANTLSAEEALQMLYRFSVIGYERRSGYGGSSWAFHYTNPEAGWDNGATTLKVHLGLKEFAKLREERASAVGVDTWMP